MSIIEIHLSKDDKLEKVDRKISLLESKVKKLEKFMGEEL